MNLRFSSANLVLTVALTMAAVLVMLLPSGSFGARGYIARLLAPTPTAVQTLACTTSGTLLPTATPNGTPPPPATFGHNTLADFSAVGGDPFIRVDKQDNVFVSSPFGFSTTVSLLFKSSDHGRTFIPLGSPILRDAVTGPGGGDTHIDFDDHNRLYYVDLSAACTTAAVSEDGGNTFPLDRTNPQTCIGSGDDPYGA